MGKMPEPTVVDTPSRLSGGKTLPFEVAAAAEPSAWQEVNAQAKPSSSKLDLYQQSNLTRNQLQVWIGQALLPELPIYNLAAALTLFGEVEVGRFRSAFQALIDSSDALRTTVVEIDGIPTQRVLSDLPYTMEYLDFSSLIDPQTAARGWMQERSSAPLDWKTRLFDSVLIKLSAKEFVWYLNVHHLICDGWSFELIYRHMSDLYQRSVQAQPLPPYSDYLAYERAYRGSSRHQKVARYWKERLSEKAEALSFYGRFPGTVTTHVRRISYDLGLERTNRLRLAARGAGSGAQQISLLQIFTAILIAYLHTLNGKQSYTIGVPFHNRRTKTFKQTIGFFSELLPIRVEVADDETLASLLNKVKSEVLSAIRHGPYAIANPYFGRVYETVVNYQTRSFTEFGGMPAFPEWVHNRHGDDSLAIQIHDFGVSGSLRLDFDLHESIFDEKESNQVVEHFVTVLESFLVDANQSLRDLTLVSPQEARQVLIEWNHAEGEPPETRCVHDIFRERVREHPEATAVILEDQRLTYLELNARANKLAHYLRKRGVGPESRVVIYVERSFETIVALLGILKAGAAYVPVDPRYPANWLRFVLSETHASVLLTQRRFLKSLPDEARSVICLDSEWEAIDSESADEIESSTTGTQLAYVIFTSGTTGDPKGVEIPHGALANFSVRAAQTFGLERSDRVLQFASIGFDTAMEEIFPCLITGATLALRTDAMLDSASAFLQKCRQWGITVLDLPTSYWHDLTARLFSEDLNLPPSVRLVVIGGERAIPERLALWQACASDRIKLLNTYGPTETTVTATACDLTDSCGDPERFTEIPIGRPLPHVQVYVLDRNLRPVPIGVPGELFIGGLGVARGYLNQPELTADKFLQNPFVDQPGSRIYRTGDLARYRPDGHLEFLGRTDRQVKIRGFRVELEGIESVLRKHPLVQDAIVVQDATSTRKPLIAYLVPEGAAVLNPDELREFAGTKLPEYMVPAAFLISRSLPLTPQGKVNRRALAAPDRALAEVSKRSAPPQTATESRIARIWREVLDVKEVGRNDHFFELGGHSLLATQAISRMRKEFAEEIPLRAIFENPVLADLAQHIGRNESQSESTPLTAPRKTDLPLSFSQSRIWFMHRLAPESSAYNIAAPIRFTGTLHKEALRRSLDEMVRRHESLRTTFRNASEEPAQVIGPPRSLTISETDLRSLPRDIRMAEAKRLLSEEARRPFDLEKGPLIRVLLVQLGGDDHVMLLTMHHAISDHWSFNTIAREVTSLYNTFCSQQTAPLQSLPAQYADFVMWQNQRLNAEQVSVQLSYWKKQLEGMQPPAFPTDRPRPSIQTFHGAHESLELSKELLEGLRKVGREANATLYMVFVAAFKILLSRYCNQEDIAVGSPVANRNRLEWEGVIGTFVNIVVLRTDLSGNPTFRETLARVRTMVIEALAHQELPFDRLIEHLHPERDPGRSPLVQILFNFHNALMGKIDLTGLSWMPFEIDQGAAQFDITVTVDPDTLQKIVVTYNTDLYDRATIGRFLDHYERILQAVVMDPDQPVATLPILSDRERHRLLVEGNATRAGYPQSCVHELFETQARKTPDAIAVVCGKEELTYRSLDERANRVAHRLRAMGVKPEVTVGICLERSLDAVVGLLAILKAGGAYVPIDPAYPPDRIAFILKDSGTLVVLTQAKIVKDLPEDGRRFLCIENVAALERSDKPEASAGLKNLAYVIYTSGSTGEPKGVEVEHKSLINFLHSVRQRPGVTEQDVLLSVTTLSFDIAALELFLPLITGARVVLVSREIAGDGRRLIQEIQNNNATVMQATPATWRLLLEAGWKGAEPFKILCGGEALSPELAKSLLDRGSSVWNLYGPTETTVWSTVGQVTSTPGLIPIGRPINNTRAYVLDANEQPVPAGVAGELYIGGDGVARGYHNRADLTREKFKRDPFSTEPEARMFKTGDLARAHADGNLEWLGRIDQQIKIRGHRIEPQEIEALLERYPAVKQAVVVAREDSPGEKQLVAYVAREKNATATTYELRRFLNSKLPEYMLPSDIVFLEAFPKTPNGKLNRRGLPPPDRAGFKSAQSFTAPRDKLEYRLAKIWERLLNVRPIGLGSNFFELGGHSLMAARLMGQVEKAFGKQIPLTAFVANPTVGHLAQLLRQEGCSERWSSLAPVQPAGSKRPFFWIHGDASNWTLEKHLGPDQPLYALLHQSQHGEVAKHKSVESIAGHYLEEIRIVQPEGPYFLGGYSFGGLVAFEIAQRLCNNGERVAFLALLEPTVPANGRLPASTQSPNPLEWASRRRDRILRYRDALASMNSAEKLCSIARGIKARVGNKTAKIAKTYKRLACKIFLRTHRPLPAGLRATYIIDIYAQAARTYSARSYPGSITLFRGEKWTQHFESFWKQLAGAGASIHAIRGEHVDLTLEPFVEMWASQLNASLQKAQERASEPDRPHGEASSS